MISKEDFSALSKEFGIKYSMIRSIYETESSGAGFDKNTGKIKIQFEPSYFKRLTKLAGGLWSKNKVDVQSKEWLAFNDAFAKNANKAMQSTSIGAMQVMGVHYSRLGFKTVGDMWAFAKQSEKNQLWIGLKFIQTDKRIYNAVLKMDFKTIAKYYNGSLYWVKGYDKKLETNEKKYGN